MAVILAGVTAQGNNDTTNTGYRIKADFNDIRPNDGGLEAEQRLYQNFLTRIHNVLTFAA